MWMTIWLACSQETAVEPSSLETKPAPEQPPSIEKVVEVKRQVEGTLFFAKSADCKDDCVAKVTRSYSEWTPQIALERLYEGPDKGEKGLRFLSCGSTMAKLRSLEDGVAKVQLEGGCQGCGTLSIYDLIVPTLKSFPKIETVQLYDANGKSQVDDAKMDSRPACLEP